MDVNGIGCTGFIEPGEDEVLNLDPHESDDEDFEVRVIIEEEEEERDIVSRLIAPGADSDDRVVEVVQPRSKVKHSFMRRWSSSDPRMFNITRVLAIFNADYKNNTFKRDRLDKMKVFNQENVLIGDDSQESRFKQGTMVAVLFKMPSNKYCFFLGRIMRMENVVGKSRTEWKRSIPLKGLSDQPFKDTLRIRCNWLQSASDTSDGDLFSSYKPETTIFRDSTRFA